MCDKNKMQKVQLLLDKLNDSQSISELMLKRQERLKALTLKHSVQVTALAAGLTISTLSQYLRVKNPHTIGEACVLQAECILSQL